MTNFAKAFADILSGGQEYKDARVQQSMSIFDHSEVDARIIDEVIHRGLMEAARALGVALDQLTPVLRSDAMPMLLGRATHNIAELEEAVTLIVFGAKNPTPGCDCDACKNVKYLREQLDETETAIRQVQRREHDHG